LIPRTDDNTSFSRLPRVLCAILLSFATVHLLEETMNDRMFHSPVFVKEGAYLVREIASIGDAADFLMEWPEDLQDLIYETALEACHAAYHGSLPVSAAREAFVGFAKKANILEDAVSAMPWMIGAGSGGGGVAT
jgi:hypothetical protein